MLIVVELKLLVQGLLLPLSWRWVDRLTGGAFSLRTENAATDVVAGSTSLDAEVTVGWAVNTSGIRKAARVAASSASARVDASWSGGTECVAAEMAKRITRRIAANTSIAEIATDALIEGESDLRSWGVAGTASIIAIGGGLYLSTGVLTAVVDGESTYSISEDTEEEVSGWFPAGGVLCEGWTDG